MRVTDIEGRETEAIGFIMDGRGEVYVLNDGSRITVAELWARFTPLPDRRHGHTRQGERRRNRARTRRQSARRVADSLTESERVDLATGRRMIPSWAATAQSTR
jgi:hypothetical protein